MVFRKFVKPLMVSAALAWVGLSAQAQTQVVNIASSPAFSTSATFAAGTYEIFWLGASSGTGATYSGYQYNNGLSGNWREAFSAQYGGTTYTFDQTVAAPYATYGTSTEAIAAFQSGPYRIYSTTTSPFVATAAGSFVSVARPTLTFDSATTVLFGAPDIQFNDNTGGVSILVSAVPEPSTYAMMLAGMVTIGFAARRRRNV